jgi:UDP-N-acetylmuramoylalanine--D-glutamate ligase
MDDFKNAAMVIKNPAVKPGSPYLAAAGRIETDISLFLGASPARLTAVTGSKGKSSVSSAIHWGLKRARERTGLPAGRAFLGGNITVSPLSFLDELRNEDDVVLELSSWQLGDLKGRGLLKPRAAAITAVMADHLDRYGTMDAYVNDKRLIYRDQDRRDATAACLDDPWGQSFLAETPGRPLPYSDRPLPGGTAGGWIDPVSGAGLVRFAGAAEGTGRVLEVVPPVPLVPGRHQKKNLVAAALVLLDLGVPAPLVLESMGSFPGIEHRLELFHEKEGIRFYNDTAATIPEAAAAAVEAFTGDTPGGSPKPLILVAGGADKDLDFRPLARAARRAGGIVLLAGTGSEKLIPLLERERLPWRGPCGSAGEAARTALELARRAGAEQTPGTAGAVVVLSPGCASFGMFQNEFDRGRQWKEAVLAL